jgi:hypothetical protein
MTNYLRFRCLICLFSAALITSCSSKQATTPGEQKPEADAPRAASTAEPASPGFTPRPADSNSNSNSNGRREQVVSLPAGTVLQVRLAQTLDTKTNHSGDRFNATLSSPVSFEGKVIIPQGSTAAGHINTSQSSGRLKGRAVMGLSLDSFDLNGKTYRIETTHVSRAGSAHKKRNIGFIAGGTGLGAALGAIAGGPKGALIGAGAGAAAGAAAGTAGAALTGKKNVHVPAESLLSFSLTAPVTVP